MPAIIVRNLSIETHRALKLRAAQHGRSTEAEIRDILEKAARPEARIRLGSLLAEIGREARLTDEERAGFEAALERDDTPVVPIGSTDDYHRYACHFGAATAGRQRPCNCINPWAEIG